MPFTTTYANSILNYTFSKVSQLTAPSAVYIGLCSNNPESDNGSITELSGGGYHRVMISQKGEMYPNLINLASDRAIVNQYQINWSKATTDWPRVKGLFLSSSPTVGETTSIFFYGALELTEEQELAGGLLVEAGAVALFDPQTFKISFPAKDVTDEAVTSE